MADKKISQLDEVISPDGSDVLAIVNEGVTKKVTVDSLLDKASSTGRVKVDADAIPDYLGDEAGNGVLRISGDIITFANGGNFITLGIDQTKIDHDQLNNTHNLTTDIDHNSITNTHNLTSDIDHTAIANVGTNSHIAIDSHIADAGIHFELGAIDHTAILNIGTNSHAVIDTHIADTDIHFELGDIDHTAILNIGTNTHAQIDTHLANANIHYEQGAIDHTAILNIGSNSHADIDTHISDLTIHFTEASISHLSITDIGTNTHADIDSHIADSNIHFTEGSIDHTAIANIGVNTHAQIDTHLSATNNPHSVTYTQVGAIQDANDTVKDSHINWGTDADQVSAVDMPIADAGSYFTGAEVETGLQELGRKFYAMNEPSGFDNRTDSTLDLTANRFTINPAVTSFNYFIRGIEYTVDSSDVADVNYIDLADIEGLHYIYYDGATLAVAVNPSDDIVETLWKTKAMVTVVYWDAVNNIGIYVGEERHGIQMDGATHSYNHFTRGLQWHSGLALNSILADQAGSLDSHAQFGIDAGSVEDEDLDTGVSAVGSTDGMNIFYRDGATGAWRRTTQAGFAVKVTGSGRLAWNELTGGSWQLTEVTNGDFVLCHIFATTEKDNPMIAIIGQVVYTKVKDARIGATTEINNILLGNLPTPEMRPIATVIFQTQDSYTNSINARIRTTDEGDDYVDWRTSEFARGVGAGDHGSQSGLQDRDHLNHFWLPGVSGGQTLIGGTDAGDDLILQSTSHATRGQIQMNDLIVGKDDAIIEGHIAIGNNTPSPPSDRKVVHIVEIITAQFNEFMGLHNVMRHDVPFEINKWMYNMKFELINNSIGTTFRDAGVLGAVRNASTGDITKAYALNGAVRNESTGTIVNAVGVQGSIINIGAGEITNAFSIADFMNVTNGLIVNLYSHFADTLNVSGAGAVTNHYQFYAKDTSAASNNWGFYQAGNNVTNRFENGLQLDRSLYIKEIATAATDIVAYGQIWVKDDTPNTLWFTDDVGTDVQLGLDRDTCGFTYNNPVFAITDYMVFQIFITSPTLGFQPARPGSITGIAVNVQGIIGLGNWSCRFEVYKNGAATGLFVDFSFIDVGTSKKSTTQAVGTDTFIADDILTIHITDTSVPLDRVSAILSAISFVEVFYD